jgi:hypothetical protein
MKDLRTPPLPGKMKMRLMTSNKFNW